LRARASHVGRIGACGDLTLTAVRLLASHLTEWRAATNYGGLSPENGSDVLAVARHKRKEGSFACCSSVAKSMPSRSAQPIALPAE
jgi:hypothetical protein